MQNSIIRFGKQQPDDDAKCLTDLFGVRNDHKESRVFIFGMFLSNLEELKNLGFGLVRQSEV